MRLGLQKTISNRPQNKLSFLYKKNSGQIAVEYVLLMVVIVSIAFLIMKALLGTMNSSTATRPQGIIPRVWGNVVQMVGQDLHDEW